MNLNVLPEALLEFAYGQRCENPHMGLTLFGPYDKGQPSQPKNISYGVIGTDKGVEYFSKFARRINLPVTNNIQIAADKVATAKNLHLWPSYPGFTALFDSTFPETPSWKKSISTDELRNSSCERDAHHRTFRSSNLYLNMIKLAAERDESLDIIFCIVPEFIWQHCRAQSAIPREEKVGASVSKREVELRRDFPEDLFGENFHPEQYDFSVDFRRHLKGRSMEYGIPIQIIRESALRLHDTVIQGERSLTCLSDRAWNISTTAYYKAGGKPWKLATARDGVCYIGLVFKLDPNSKKEKTACCAAQMFLDSGDGVVFRGEFGPWYSPEKKEFHLSTDAAKALLEGVIETYQSQEGKPLREIFIHSHSSIYHSEWEGFLSACPAGVKISGVRVRTAIDGIRLYREGNWPVLRGTYWAISERIAYLWGNGFKPALFTYDGSGVPVPLRIDIQYGSANIEQVVEDIFALTKLNFNTCKLGDSKPVTIGFSDKVGEILVGNKNLERRQPNFKFYI